MAVIWYQRIGKECRLIDCDSAVGVGIDWLADRLNDRNRDKGYVYAPIPVMLPHDAGHPQSSNKGGASFGEKLKADYGYAGKVNPVTKSLWWSIEQTRKFLATCVVDEAGCDKLLVALRHYHRKWDPVRRTFGDHPVHDWSSN